MLTCVYGIGSYPWIFHLALIAAKIEKHVKNHEILQKKYVKRLRNMISTNYD